jgi:hypothetical protein
MYAISIDISNESGNIHNLYFILFIFGCVKGEVCEFAGSALLPLMPLPRPTLVPQPQGSQALSCWAGGSRRAANEAFTLNMSLYVRILAVLRDMANTLGSCANKWIF